MVNPGRSAVLSPGILAILFLSKENKDTGAAVADIDHIKDESTEACQIILPFLRILLKEHREEKLKRL